MKLGSACSSLALLALSAIGAGQVFATSSSCCCGDGELQLNLEYLRSRPSFRFRLENYEGGPAGPGRLDRSVAFLKHSGGRAQFELREFSGNTLVQRLVGDGETFYDYNAIANTFDARPYRGDPGRLAVCIRDAAGTPASRALAKLLGQAYGRVEPTMWSWLPGGGVNLNDHVVSIDAPSFNGSMESFSLIGFPLRKVSRVIRTSGFPQHESRWTIDVDAIPIGVGVGGADFTFTPPSGAIAR